jgi:hypothetical protein
MLLLYQYGATFWLLALYIPALKNGVFRAGLDKLKSR